MQQCCDSFLTVILSNHRLFRSDEINYWVDIEIIYYRKDHARIPATLLILIESVRVGTKKCNRASSFENYVIQDIIAFPITARFQN